MNYVLKKTVDWIFRKKTILYILVMALFREFIAIGTNETFSQLELDESLQDWYIHYPLIVLKLIFSGGDWKIVAVLVVLIIFFRISDVVESYLFNKKPAPNKPATENEPFSINIISNQVRCFIEWRDYGLKLDFELFFNRKTLIKSIRLDYKEPLAFGEKWTEHTELYMVDLIKEDLLKEELPQIMDSLNSMEQLLLSPQNFDEKSILQVTLGGYLAGERLPDGWEGISLSGWTLLIEYDDNKLFKIPLILEKHNDSLQRATEWKYIGFKFE